MIGNTKAHPALHFCAQVSCARHAIAATAANSTWAFFAILLGMICVIVCPGCGPRRSDPEDLRSKFERQFRGVWQSCEFATDDPEFASCTNVMIYVYRVGEFRTNEPIIAEMTGAFVYRGSDGREVWKYPVQLASDKRIRVGGFMEGIWPEYVFKNGLLILSIDDGSYYYKAALSKVSSDPGDPAVVLPPWVFQSQEQY